MRKLLYKNMAKGGKDYTVKEFIEHVMGDVNQKIDVILGDVKETKEKVDFQNGRVRKLEDWSIEAHKLIEANVSAISTFNLERAKVVGGYKVVTIIAIAVPIICTTIFGLYMKNRDNEIDTKIQKSIQTSIQTSYQESEERISEIVEKVLSDKIIESVYAR